MGFLFDMFAIGLLFDEQVACNRAAVFRHSVPALPRTCSVSRHRSSRVVWTIKGTVHVLRVWELMQVYICQLASRLNVRGTAEARMFTICPPFHLLGVLPCRFVFQPAGLQKPCIFRPHTQSAQPSHTLCPPSPSGSLSRQPVRTLPFNGE